MLVITVRDAQPGDRDDLYDVCLRTGDEGRDATALMSRPRLLGDIFVGPYLTFAPEYALVADDDRRAAGYALAVLDTGLFEERLEDEWWPQLRAAYPDPGPAAADGGEDGLLALVHGSEFARHPDLPGYPSHLHVDLLEHVRGDGIGTQMMRELFTRLQAAGSCGVHLGVAAVNEGAIRFYRRLGFHELCQRSDELYLGLSWDVVEQPGQAARTGTPPTQTP